MLRKILIEAIVFLYIVLFLYASGTKLVEYETSVAQISQSPILTNYANTVAWLVPLMEIAIALMLMTRRTRVAGMYASFGLMVLFTMYVAAILSFSKELPCACGGVLSMLHWKGHLIFNIVFVGLGLLAIDLMKKDSIVTAQDMSAK